MKNYRRDIKRTASNSQLFCLLGGLTGFEFGSVGGAVEAVVEPEVAEEVGGEVGSEDDDVARPVRIQKHSDHDVSPLKLKERTRRNKQKQKF